MVASVAGELERRQDPAPPAVSRAAPQRLDAGAGRRRAAGAAGRDQPRAPRRAVPRRAARIPAPGARFAAPAARDRQRQRRPRQCPRDLSGAGAAGRGDEPCRCGHLGDPALACSRAPRCAADYQAQGLGPAARPHRPPCRGAGRVRRRPHACRRPPKAAPKSRTRRRGARRSRPSATTARASAPTPRRTASCSTRSRRPTSPGRKLLAEAAEAMRLSARGFHRVLRVARTIADLAGAERGRPDPRRRSAQLPTAAPPQLRGLRPPVKQLTSDPFAGGNRCRTYRRSHGHFAH